MQDASAAHAKVHGWLANLSYVPRTMGRYEKFVKKPRS